MVPQTLGRVSAQMRITNTVQTLLYCRSRVALLTFTNHVDAPVVGLHESLTCFDARATATHAAAQSSDAG
jgi:hypothetical protein